MNVPAWVRGRAWCAVPGAEVVYGGGLPRRGVWLAACGPRLSWCCSRRPVTIESKGGPSLSSAHYLSPYRAEPEGHSHWPPQCTALAYNAMTGHMPFKGLIITFPFYSVRSTGKLFTQHVGYILKRFEKGENWRLRCFPGLFIIGAAKSGTTDLYSQVDTGRQKCHNSYTLSVVLGKKPALSNDVSLSQFSRGWGRHYHLQYIGIICILPYH